MDRAESSSPYCAHRSPISLCVALTSGQYVCISRNSGTLHLILFAAEILFLDVDGTSYVALRYFLVAWKMSQAYVVTCLRRPCRYKTIH